MRPAGHPPDTTTLKRGSWPSQTNHGLRRRSGQQPTTRPSNIKLLAQCCTSNTPLTPLPHCKHIGLHREWLVSWCLGGGSSGPHHSSGSSGVAIPIAGGDGGGGGSASVAQSRLNEQTDRQLTVLTLITQHGQQISHQVLNGGGQVLSLVSGH